MARKGQAAMEFLMTYGWAILAAIVVIAVLAIYFNPGSLGTTKTIINEPLGRVAESATTTNIQLEIKNSGASSINITSAALTFKVPNTASCDDVTSTGALAPGRQVVLDFANCANLESGKKFSADLVVKFLESGATIESQTTGTIAGTVQ